MASQYCTISPGLADEYDSSKTYTEGMFTLKDNAYWFCKSGTVTGEWDSSRWTKVLVPLHNQYAYSEVLSELPGTMETNTTYTVSIPETHSTTLTFGKPVPTSGGLVCDFCVVIFPSEEFENGLTIAYPTEASDGRSIKWFSPDKTAAKKVAGGTPSVFYFSQFNYSTANTVYFAVSKAEMELFE